MFQKQYPIYSFDNVDHWNTIMEILVLIKIDKDQ